MKATEFRIGNLLELPNGQPVQISIDSLKEIESGIHPYQKIPLTEEWLLKFGFEKIYEYYYKGRFFIENLFDNRFTFRITINNAESAHANSVKYVHQLQNLYFALTGEELIIK